MKGLLDPQAELRTMAGAWHGTRLPLTGYLGRMVIRTRRVILTVRRTVRIGIRMVFLAIANNLLVGLETNVPCTTDRGAASLEALWLVRPQHRSGARPTLWGRAREGLHGCDDPGALRPTSQRPSFPNAPHDSNRLDVSPPRTMYVLVGLPGEASERGRAPLADSRFLFVAPCPALALRASDLSSSFRVVI